MNNHFTLHRRPRPCTFAIASALFFAASSICGAQSVPPATASASPPAAITALYNKENSAVASRNFAQFIAPGTPAFKKAITKQTFTSACANVSSSLKSGYTSQFAGARVVQGSTVYIWNLTCKNSVKFLAVMGVTGGKVSAYLYQPPMPAPAK